MTDHEEVAGQLDRTAERIEEPSPEVSHALDRVEQKVEQALSHASSQPAPPFSKVQTWVLTIILVGLEVATLLVVYFDIGTRNSRRVDTLKFQDRIERQLTGIACLQIVPRPERTFEDASRCDVSYIPGGRR